MRPNCACSSSSAFLSMLCSFAPTSASEPTPKKAVISALRLRQDHECIGKRALSFAGAFETLLLSLPGSPTRIRRLDSVVDRPRDIQDRIRGRGEVQFVSDCSHLSRENRLVLFHFGDAVSETGLFLERGTEIGDGGKDFANRFERRRRAGLAQPAGRARLGPCGAPSWSAAVAFSASRSRFFRSRWRSSTASRQVLQLGLTIDGGLRCRQKHLNARVRFIGYARRSKCGRQPFPGSLRRRRPPHADRVLPRE